MRSVNFFPENAQQEIEFFADILHKIEKIMGIWVKK